MAAALEEAELRFYADGADAPTLASPMPVNHDVLGLFGSQKLNAMKVAIIDYGSGNLHSALKAFERAAGASGQITVTADPDVVRKAERIVLPGVGAFKDCYEGLMAVPGMRDTLAGAGHCARQTFPRNLRGHAAHGHARP